MKNFLPNLTLQQQYNPITIFSIFVIDRYTNNSTNQSIRLNPTITFQKCGPPNAILKLSHPIATQTRRIDFRSFVVIILEE
ncbi:hypothetical protein ACH3XW_31105 [Acanthocheilonema viteae]